MKTIIALLAATAVVAGASNAAATEFQASDEAVNNALSHSVGGAGWTYGGAYNSVGVPRGAYNSTFDIPRTPYDFQMDGRN